MYRKKKTEINTLDPFHSQFKEKKYALRLKKSAPPMWREHNAKIM